MHEYYTSVTGLLGDRRTITLGLLSLGFLIDVAEVEELDPLSPILLARVLGVTGDVLWGISSDTLLCQAKELNCL